MPIASVESGASGGKSGVRPATSSGPPVECTRLEIAEGFLLSRFPNRRLNATGSKSLKGFRGRDFQAAS
ncbi:MAG: hypothetical protein ACXWUR_00495 [Allosphingosinicella sp.]